MPSSGSVTARHNRQVMGTAALAAAVILGGTFLGGCGGGGTREANGGGRMSVRADSGAVGGSDHYYGGGSYGGGGSASTPRQEGYVTAYASGRYSVAKSLAEAEIRRGPGRSADRAALIAGLSAHAMEELGEAERLLAPLVSNEDREVAGRAEACLGLIARDRKQHDKAATLLISASRKLSGDESARAAMFAGDELATLNRQAESRTQYTMASTSASSASLKRAIAERLEVGEYTVQVGVFSQRSNAQKAMMDVAPTASMLGLGEPRIIERAEGAGRRSYVVQVGRFTSRRQANLAQSRLGSGWPVSLASGE